MNHKSKTHFFQHVLKILLVLCLCLVEIKTKATFAQETSVDVLTSAEWESVDDSVERALVWLASTQQRNGSFPTLPQGQPGVTSLCVMAFVAQGHVPGEGPYGAQLLKAIEYIASCQKQNGLLSLIAPRGETISRNVSYEISNTAPYNHALSGLTLSEAYAMGQASQIENLDSTIKNAIEATLAMQRWPKRVPEEKGGWRYLNVQGDFNADLSVSGWQLMFLRSAKNAGFDVPQKPIDEAVGFVRKCYRPKFGAFLLRVTDIDERSRGMAGAGILALAHAGLHDAPEAIQAGEWILEQDFRRYNQIERFTQTQFPRDRYHYSAFVCTQAMYQLGGKYWQQFYPPMVRVLLKNQTPEGSWPAENHRYDGQFGTTYSTALAVMALGAPNQLLPIFQR